MIYTHVLNVAAGGTSSPLDALDFGAPVRHRDDATPARLDVMLLQAAIYSFFIKSPLYKGLMS